MHPLTHEYFTGKKPIFVSPNPYFNLRLKDTHVSYSSLCHESVVTPMSIQSDLSHLTPNIM